MVIVLYLWIELCQARPSRGASGIDQAQQAARPAQCAQDIERFKHCFLCGKLADNGRIYRECCEGEETVSLFCDHLMV